MSDTKHILTGSNLTGYKCSQCLKSWDVTPTEEILKTRCDGPRPDFSQSFSFTITGIDPTNRLVFYETRFDPEDESNGTRADDLGNELLKGAGYE